MNNNIGVGDLVLFDGSIPEAIGIVVNERHYWGGSPIKDLADVYWFSTWLNKPLRILTAEGGIHKLRLKLLSKCPERG
jgi:hypothetical protein|tara:strand:- start:16406 stop:16639 length:234 start_codon:yes stop_codon:yes gene_type:complete